MSRQRILYVGPDYVGSNGTCWRDAFVTLGHDVKTVDDEALVPEPQTLPGKMIRKLRGRPTDNHVAFLNDCVVRALREFRPDFTFYIKARHILPRTLEESATFGPNLAYMNDDMFNPINQSFTFFENVKRFDCILTTKSFNVREFHGCGAPLAIYIPNAYDPRIHYPATPSPEEAVRFQGDIGFLGTFRPDRADFLSRFAAYRRELRLNVWGSGWSKTRRFDYWHKRWAWRELAHCLRGGELRGADMGKAIQSNGISLGLLFHGNRDLHTSRSFEIPACCGFMLAERTEEHRMYFEEDREAVYFSSFDEALSKIRFYISHDSIRRQIALAGHLRCINSRATYLDRAEFAIDQYLSLRRKASASGLGRASEQVNQAQAHPDSDISTRRATPLVPRPAAGS